MVSSRSAVARDLASRLREPGFESCAFFHTFANSLRHGGMPARDTNMVFD